MARLRPSKPMAVFSALGALAIVIFGVVNMPRDTGFFWLWIAIGAGVIGMTLWSAFSKKGSMYQVDDDQPTG